jgi:NitT/TauT family transport system substrate-binding protein
MTTRDKLLLGLSLAALLGFAPAAQAADKITLMVGGYEKIIYLPAKLAERLGYFKDEGLEVELLNEGAGVDAENEMLAGAVEGVVGFYDHCVDLQTKGKYIESIVQMAHAPGEVELVSNKYPAVKGMGDLRGKTLGVTGLGSSTNFLTQFLMVKAGVPVGQFTSSPVGAGSTFIIAMQQDKIQGGMTTEPTITRLVKTNQARVLVDLRTRESTSAALGGTYPAASLYMTTSWVETHKPIVQKLANAFVKTLRYINTHTGAQIAAQMPKDFFVGDQDGYIKALDSGKGMFTADGVMPKGGPETVLQVLSTFSPNLKGKSIDLSRTYTTEFVSKVK